MKIDLKAIIHMYISAKRPIVLDDTSLYSKGLVLSHLPLDVPLRRESSALETHFVEHLEVKDLGLNYLGQFTVVK